MNLKLLSVFVLTLFCYNSCFAQNGYKYPRPDGSLGQSGNALAAVASPIRPVVGISPSSPPTAFGVTPSFQASGLTPTPAYGYQSPSRPTSSSFGVSANAGASQFPSASGYPATASAIIGNRPVIPSRPGSIYSSTSTGISRQPFNNVDGNLEGDYSAIPGEPGVDYPVFSETPQTNFDCNQQQYPGYYADVEARCQVFHICALNRTYSFLCPNGTIFSQATLVCVWWNQYDCGSAPVLYPNNAFIYDYSQTGENRPATDVYAGTAQQGGLSTRPVIAQSFVGRSNPNAAVFSAGVRPTGPNTKFSNTGSQQPSIPSFANTPTATGTGTSYNIAGGYTGGTQPGAYSMGTGPTGPSAGNFGGSAIGPGFGTTIRPGFATEPTFPVSQLSPTAGNREYLPPRRP